MPDQFTELLGVEMCVFIDGHDVAGAPGGSIMPIDRLRTVPVVMMASFVDGDKGAKLKNIVSVCLNSLIESDAPVCIDLIGTNEAAVRAVIAGAKLRNERIA